MNNDIAKCNGRNCKVRDDCLRYAVELTGYVWVANFDRPENTNKGKNCREFYEKG